MQTLETSRDESEIAKFDAMADEWWDPDGKFAPLHMLNPCRLDYVAGQIAAQFGRDLTCARPFDGLRILDIGCGGGLLSEPMARLGAAVVGADAAGRNVAAAAAHAARSGLDVDYRHATAEEIALNGERFDAVLCMEVIEHAASPRILLEACRELLVPGGLLLCSTINRTARSFALAIVGAEYILRWLPRGTHDWKRFITPDELFALLGEAGLSPVDSKGFVFNPLSWKWSLSSRDLHVNYVAASVRPDAAA